MNFAGKSTAGLLAQAIENQTCLFFISIMPSATDRKEEIEAKEEVFSNKKDVHSVSGDIHSVFSRSTQKNSLTVQNIIYS